MSFSDSLVQWLCRPNIPLFNQPLGAFRLHPDVLAGVIALVGLYLVALTALGQKSGAQTTPRHRRYLIFAVVALLVAEVSPLHDLAEGYLLSAHMVQHFLLVYLFPPLILKSLPGGLFQPIERNRIAMAVGRVLTNPIVALFLGNAVYALWHIPAAYQAALLRHEIHILEHILMVGSAIIMWWPVFSPMKALPPLTEPLRLVYLFFMSVAQIGVYAYVTFAGNVLYPFYSTAPRLWNISPELDQVLAGLIMKLGMTIVLIPIFTATFFRWAKQQQEPSDVIQ